MAEFYRPPHGLRDLSKEGFESIVIPSKIRGQLKQHGAKTLVLDEWHQTRQHSLHIGDSIGPQPVHVGNLAMRLRRIEKTGRCLVQPCANRLLCRQPIPNAIQLNSVIPTSIVETENQWILASLGKIVLRPARACMNNRRGRYECGSSSDTRKEIQCGAVNACRSRPFNKYMLGRRCIPGDQP